MASPPDEMPAVILAPGRDRSVRRRHPWVLSGSVASVVGAPEPGAFVRVLSAEGEVLAGGHYSPHSNLRVRLLVFGKEFPEEGDLRGAIARAVAARGEPSLFAGTDAVRLVNAEADGLPGIVADRYGDLVVLKLTSVGAAVRRDEIALALRAASGAAAGYERGDGVAARREGFPTRQGPLWGDAPQAPVEITERGRRYRVDAVAGQKTGFYLDQRDARDLVQRLANGRRVLDAFAYTGGFSVAAAHGGAASVTLVDSSAGALALARENLDMAPAVSAHVECADVFRFLRGTDASFDLIVLDPPPLARNRRDISRATRAYKDALLHALRRAAPDAFLLAFACSHHVGPDLFRKVVFGAALDAGRSVQILQTLGAAPDHPVSVYHPEGDYLTGLLLRA